MSQNVKVVKVKKRICYGICIKHVNKKFNENFKETLSLRK